MNNYLFWVLIVIVLSWAVYLWVTSNRIVILNINVQGGIPNWFLQVIEGLKETKKTS